MNDINVSFNDGKTEVDEKKVEKFCQNVLNFLNIENWEVSIVFCDNEFIRSLNNRYRGKDKPTDVLSFGQSDETEKEFDAHVFPGKYIAGDIVISLDMVKANADTCSVPVEEELKRVLIHGLLHLRGMDHAGKTIAENEAGSAETSEMLQLQESILNKLYEEKVF